MDTTEADYFLVSEQELKIQRIRSKYVYMDMLESSEIWHHMKSEKFFLYDLNIWLEKALHHCAQTDFSPDSKFEFFWKDGRGQIIVDDAMWGEVVLTEYGLKLLGNPEYAWILLSKQFITKWELLCNDFENLYESSDDEIYSDSD